MGILIAFFLILIISAVIVIAIHQEKVYKEREHLERDLERQEEERLEREHLLFFQEFSNNAIIERECQERGRQERERLEKEYKQLESDVLKKIEFSDWKVVFRYDEEVIVNSRQALDKYDIIKFFKDHKEKLEQAENIIKRNIEITETLNLFLKNNEYKTHPQYNRLIKQINNVLMYAKGYKIEVSYISSAGNYLDANIITVNQYDIDKFKQDPSLLMSKGEYNIYLKELLSTKHSEYYENVNNIISYANDNKDNLVIKGGIEKLDNSIDQLFDRTVNSIKKIKTIDSEEWDIIGNYITNIKEDIEKEVSENLRILEYYKSADFLKIKDTCEALMSTQREFNEYITEKVESISRLFGTRVVREETTNNDEYSYIRNYKKTINPFTAEVSSTVFASAENNPLDYIIKNFYPNKDLYLEQIQKLHQLIEELETLKEAKLIIENYKVEYQQYLNDVPDFIIENDKSGFYSRLGFANVDESVLTVDYKFSYTSGGGMAKRSFTVPMTEENIIELINLLSSKLTEKAFVKEQRALMTKKLRDFIKNRDNFTCCNCGNSINIEPNLLLEIDHITPVSKGGCTIQENLQTLCWKCNRAKSDKIIS